MHTTAATTVPRSLRNRLIAGAALVGVSLTGLAACQLPTSSATVRSASAVQIDKADHTPDTTPDTTVPPSTTEPPVTNPPVTLPPISLPPVTTPAPAPETTVPATVPATPVAIPAGALDLGDGVYVPVTAGWTGTLTDGVVHLTDGTMEVLIQVVRRTPGESPQLVLDEYVAASIDPLGTVSFGPATLRWSTDTPRPAMEYGFFYTTFDPAAADGKGIAGSASAYIRDDGLTLVYDVWAPASVSGSLSDESFNALIDSFLFAPEVAAPAALAMVPDFRVTTANAIARLDGTAGFTAAPGFVIQAATAEYALAGSAASEIAVIRTSGHPDQVDALATGMATAAQLLDGVVFAEDQWFGEADGLGVAGSSISFTAGNRSGSVVVYLDTTNGHAYTVLTVSDGAPGASVDAAALAFMQHSMLNSFGNIA